MAQPILDDLELQQVQNLDISEEEVLVQHAVPALEGDFFQPLGRRALGVALRGILSGPEVKNKLEKPREKFRAALPVPFVTDIATATKVDKVLIEELGVRELAGKPERFEYAFKLREFIPPPAPEQEEPPPVQPEPPLVDTATLIVEVIVEGDPNFDFSLVTVRIEGEQSDGITLSRTLTNRENNVWTEEDFPPGNYTAKAEVTEPPPMANSEHVEVPESGTKQVTITLRRDQATNLATKFMIHFRFDKAFIEPCMRMVMREVADYAKNHPDEKLLIVGHTDFVGDLPPVQPLYNQSLSERRARSAYAYLTFGRDRAATIAEWDQLRRERAAGVRRTIFDTWGAREYQYMLQDLGYYSGNVNGEHRDNDETDQAVRAFQADHGLSVDGEVGDQTWPVLIEAYMAQDNLEVDEAGLLKNATDECDSGFLKWLGCGEEDPVKNTEDAWRPNRRTEFLFVKVDKLPCEVPKPDTFDLPAPGAVNSDWCLGPDDPNEERCCFVIPNLTPEDFVPEEGQWHRVPHDPRTIPVRGSIKFEDGTPLANAKYFLIAPDGEFMDGERASGPSRGEPILGHTDANGEFDYGGDRLKPVGVYTMEIQEPVIARMKDEPAEEAKGNVVCGRLEGSSDFEVIVTPRPASLEFVDAANIDRTLDLVRWAGGPFRIRADMPGVVGDEITVEITSYLIRRR